MNRRRFFSLLAALGATAQAPSPAGLLGASGEPYFTDWLNGFYARALLDGIPRTVLDRELSGLSPDPRVIGADARQPEYARPVSDYVRSAVTDGRANIGRAKAAAIPQIPAIEQRFGVPREILVAIWAMESGYGANEGDLDVIRCLATLAASGRRRAWAEDELLDTLRIIQRGEASRLRLRGSWAGAMGQTQILPSVYLSTAVDGDGDGRKDVWGSPADALATAANLLAKAGWKRGEGWAREVILRPGFDAGLSEGPKLTPEQWRSRGAIRPNGLGWSAADATETWTLLLPCGVSGPAFLASPNHFVIRAYNNSLAYALSVGLLADRVAGAPALVTPWPRETPLSLSDRMAAQTALAAKGFNPGQVDGVIGFDTRQALREWQRTQHLPADGYLSADMVRRLRAA